MSESNTAVRRPLPLWPYSASDNVNRALNSQPGKTAGGSQHAVRGFLVALRDRPAPGDCAAHVAEHGQRRRPHLRSERHTRPAGPAGLRDGETDLPVGRRQSGAVLPACAMPPACCCLPDLRRAATTRIAASSACSPKSTSRSPFPRTWNGSASGPSIWWLPRIGRRAALQQYVEQGGHLLIASAHPPEFPVARVIATTPDVKGYLRVRNHAEFPVSGRHGPAAAQRTVHDARRRRVEVALPGAALDDRAAREGACRYAGHEHAGHRHQEHRQGHGGVAALGVGRALLSPQPAGPRRPLPRRGRRLCIRNAS